jgi:hypothetical protein
LEGLDCSGWQHALMKHGGQSGRLIHLEFAAGRPCHQETLLHSGGAVDFEEIEHQRARRFLVALPDKMKGHAVNVLNDGIRYLLNVWKRGQCGEIDPRFHDHVFNEGRLDGIVNLAFRQFTPFGILPAEFPVDHTVGGRTAERLSPFGYERVLSPCALVSRNILCQPHYAVISKQRRRTAV